MNRKPLVVSVGCPAGIGPEVAVRALLAFREPVVLVGNATQLHELAARYGVPRERYDVVDPMPRLSTRHRLSGKPTPTSGRAQLAYLNTAVELVRRNEARALVTGPVSKRVIVSSGAIKVFTGHTEHLANAFGVNDVTMAFWSPKLVASLVTTHVPLAQVPRLVTSRRVRVSVLQTVALLHRLGIARPKVAVTGLNPHAGEQGQFGREELDAVAPAISLARRALRGAADIVGPIGAETAFRRAAERAFDAVVAMHHDQATIAMKLLGFGDAVNVTLGLPIVRTSVDHGTAYDVAGKGIADPRGMVSALRLASRLTRKVAGTENAHCLR